MLPISREHAGNRSKADHRTSKTRPWQTANVMGTRWAPCKLCYRIIKFQLLAGSHCHGGQFQLILRPSPVPNMGICPNCAKRVVSIDSSAVARFQYGNQLKLRQPGAISTDSSAVARFQYGNQLKLRQPGAISIDSSAVARFQYGNQLKLRHRARFQLILRPSPVSNMGIN